MKKEVKPYLRVYKINIPRFVSVHLTRVYNTNSSYEVVYYTEKGLKLDDDDLKIL